MKREQIAGVLALNRGAASAVAKELGVSPASVSQWLSGKFQSERIRAACERKAETLLAMEKANRKVKLFRARETEANGDKN